MMSRRLFASCTLCALTGFIATDAQAETGGPAPVTRKILSQVDGPVDGYVTLIAEVTIAAGVRAPRHTHPGIESGYIVSGGGSLTRDGEPDEAANPGSGFQIPAGLIHGFKNGAAPTIIVSTYVVEKGKPLATPAA
jgi:quercetin dioxygenase-like cupin family protein